MKKILSFSAVAGMAVAVFFTTQNVDQSSNVALADLAKLNTANAECVTSPFQSLNTGYCSFTGNCYWSGGGRQECDPYPAPETY